MDRAGSGNIIIWKVRPLDDMSETLCRIEFVEKIYDTNNDRSKGAAALVFYFTIFNNDDDRTRTLISEIFRRF